MRLTLRTLLAYLDGVLEPADHEDLHQQIEASDYARDLIHRARDVSRRLRLGTAEPLGEGPIDDPNTMAEYLDNALPVESVPEFERHCLESDAMLAEAAASHHVLAMVLGRPAEVDPETRDRLHALPSTLIDKPLVRVDAAHAAASQSASAPVAAPPTGEAGLPDYLRERDGGSLLRWAPAIAAAALLAATAYLTLGSREQQATTVAETDTSVAGDEAPIVAAEEATPPNDDDPIGDEAVVAGADGGVAAEASTPVDGVEEPVLPDEGLAALVSDSAPTDSDAAEEPLEIEEPPADGEAVVGGAELAADDPDEMEATDAASLETPAEEVVTVDPPPVDAGRLVGPAGCVLVQEVTPDTWTRVPVEARIEFDRRFVMLPTYRGELDLSNGLNVRVVGLSEMVFPPPSVEERTPELDLKYGRVIVSNLGEEPQSLRLRLAGLSGAVEIEPTGSLAIDSDRPFVAGFDVLNVSPPPRTALYSPRSGVTWIADGVRIRPESPKQWVLPPTGGIASLVDYEGDPGWIESVRLTTWDEQASPRLASAVEADAEAWPQLQTVIDNSAFKEVRSLAARCSAAVSHPEPLVASFSDEDQRPIWVDSLTELRRLVSRSTVEAERVRRAFEAKYGERSAELFPLVRGFSTTEPPRESLDGLLDVLESDTLAARVLANLNLEELTGRQDVFRPEDSLKDRRRAVRRLRKLLQDDELAIRATGL